MSSGLFREMLNGMEYTSKLENIKNMNKKLPILLLSGSMDPVGDFSKGITKTYHKFKKNGIKDIRLNIYPNLRHDILNEKCYQDIYNDIYNWLNDKLINNNK